MEEDSRQDISRDEIKKEFQVERMILFSDAVFAIVITLMAIEIHLPETEHPITGEELPAILLHLVPVVLSYAVSFIFIGAIWFQHLRIFSIIKDYDKGLVIRNLVLLFFIGLFPFTASIITRAKGNPLAFFLYIAIILLCITSQYILYHYVVIKRPALRVSSGLKEHLYELKKRKIALICFSTIILLIAISYINISDRELKNLSTLWMVAFPIAYKLLIRKKKTDS
jgi:uncharacterized membrane protein